eukprot:scaffold605_cov400-Prasinococcus_capsulatus_cf.AAC.3
MAANVSLACHVGSLAAYAEHLQRGEESTRQAVVWQGAERFILTVCTTQFRRLHKRGTSYPPSASRSTCPVQTIDHTIETWFVQDPVAETSYQQLYSLALLHLTAAHRPQPSLSTSAGSLAAAAATTPRYHTPPVSGTAEM